MASGNILHAFDSLLGLPVLAYGSKIRSGQKYGLGLDLEVVNPVYN